MTRLSTSTRILALQLVCTVAITGCLKSEHTATDTTARRPDTTMRGETTTALKPLVALDSSRVEQLVTSYRFEQERQPVRSAKPLATSKNEGVRRADKPSQLTIATAVPGASMLGVEVIARITSNRAYPGLGIGTRANYIVRDKRGSANERNWVVYLVSTHPFGVTRLKPYSEAYSDGDPREPRIVYNEFQTGVHPLIDMIAYGVCIDDPNLCPTGHCGYNNLD